MLIRISHIIDLYWDKIRFGRTDTHTRLTPSSILTFPSTTPLPHSTHCELDVAKIVCSQLIQKIDTNILVDSVLSFSLETESVCSFYRLPKGLQANDHPGPEVVAEAIKVLKLVSSASTEFDLKLESHLFGGCAIDATGEALPASTLKACQEADAILMGPNYSFLIQLLPMLTKR